MVEANMDMEATAGTSGDGPLVSAARTVEHGIGKTIEKAKAGAGQVKETVGKTAAKAKAGVKELPNKSLGELAGNVTEYAKEHPGQTILVSLGVGAMIGMLLSRRCR